MASNNKLPFLYLSLLFLLQLSAAQAQSVVKGGYWFRASEFPLSSIDSSLFTHLFCAFADLNTQTNQVVISQANLASFSSFTQTVKLKNPNIKTLLSIAGGSAPSSIYGAMASQASSRKAFIDSAIQLARRYSFSGIDLDWEGQTLASEMTNLGILLDEFRAAVRKESIDTRLTPLNLTAALAFTTQTNGQTYPIASLARNLDWINLMIYDFYAPDRSAVTRSHAALYDPSSQVSGSSGVNAWIRAGVPAKKLVLGFPLYGYAYRLVNPNNRGLFAPANGVDTSVAYSDGSIGYNQIRTFISSRSATTVYNATIVSDYCSSGTTWIGYDDLQSVSNKVKYAKGKGLLGYFAWHVGVDNNWALSRQALQAWGA